MGELYAGASIGEDHAGRNNLTNISISFLGAAEGVTGSRHMLDVDGTRVLVDCGLFQGRRSEARERNRDLGVDPQTVDQVVLTHAHIDHSGALPIFCRDGFRGFIHGTGATVDLAQIMLRDSGHIQESDARHFNRRLMKDARRKGKKHVNPDLEIQPLYTVEDAALCDAKFKTIGYQQRREIEPGIFIELFDQGHIIGSASVLVTVERGAKPFRIVFSGDRGRSHKPILRDPQPYPECDVLLTETTYGNRRHENAVDMEARLAEVLKPLVERPGRAIIPAFSVGRTQNILYHLHEIFSKGTLPQMPVYVDSPLSRRATKVYANHPECYDQETKALLSDRENPLHFEGLRYVESVEESKSLNDVDGPAVIISASGMCEGGRILHHLKRSVERENDVILIVGWQAPNTLGRRIREREREVRIFGKTYELNARVETMNGLSAHADRDDLVESVAHLKDSLQTLFLVHGERVQSEPFQKRLLGLGHRDVRIAELGQTVQLT